MKDDRGAALYEAFLHGDGSALEVLLYAIALGYPDEAPEAKSRDMSKVKFIE